MKTGVRNLVRKADGTLDPSSLVEAGLTAVKEWLRRRLEGHDPYFPVDHRTDEDPSALVAHMLRDNGFAEPGCKLVALVILQLLDESRAVSGQFPTYFPELLELCQSQFVPGLADWFTNRLAEAASDRDRFWNTWGGPDLTKEILFAARIQAPAIPQTPSYQHWQTLLKSPNYGTIALFALGNRFSHRVLYLRDWWEKCPADHRQDDLNQIITSGLRSEGQETILTPLRAQAREKAWPVRLVAEINSVLAKRGLRESLLTHEGKDNKLNLISSDASYNEAPVPCYEVNLQGYLTHVSRQLTALLGFNQDELIGQSESFFAADPREPQNKNLRPSKAKDGSGFYNLLRTDRSDLPCFTNSVELKDGRGNVTGFFVIVEDKRATTELELSASWTDTEFQRLVDDVPFYILWKDLDSRIVHANKLFRDELLQNRGIKRWRGVTDSRIYSRDLAKRYISDDQRVLTEGILLEKIEEHEQRKGGRPRLVHVIKVPVRNLREETVGIQVIFWYLNQRKEAIDNLRKKRREAIEKVKQIFEDSHVGFYRSTEGGQFLSVNPALARLLGYESPQGMIDAVRDIAEEFYVEKAFKREQFKRLFEKTDRITGFVYRVKRRDGLEIEVSEDARIIRDANNKPLFYEGTITQTGGER